MIRAIKAFAANAARRHRPSALDWHRLLAPAIRCSRRLTNRRYRLIRLAAGASGPRDLSGRIAAR
jgi:hypothetical protein